MHGNFSHGGTSPFASLKQPTSLLITDSRSPSLLMHTRRSAPCPAWCAAATFHAPQWDADGWDACRHATSWYAAWHAIHDEARAADGNAADAADGNAAAAASWLRWTTRYSCLFIDMSMRVCPTIATFLAPLQLTKVDRQGLPRIPMEGL